MQLHTLAIGSISGLLLSENSMSLKYRTQIPPPSLTVGWNKRFDGLKWESNWYLLGTLKPFHGQGSEVRRCLEDVYQYSGRSFIKSFIMSALNSVFYSFQFEGKGNILDHKGADRLTWVYVSTRARYWTSDAALIWRYFEHRFKGVACQKLMSSVGMIAYQIF